MGLNGIRNPAKLRKVAALVGEPVTIAFARFFANQHDWLAFGVSGRVYAVNLKAGTVEPYEEEGRTITPYTDKDGRITGVRSQ